ncbi:Hypothetical protein D9617_22g065920 [Elsinoe fawcettii]|nr:Hypothetical protein D9617_22g065920 [Elsinoe fawcettii]
MAADIQFYYAPGACSLAPHILLYESQIPFKAIPATVNATTSSFPDKYHLINPETRVPAIILDGDINTEVPAVATAISQLVPDLHLMGKTPSEIAHVYEWMCWLSATVHQQGFGHLFRPQRYCKDQAAEGSIKERALQHIDDCFQKIEKKLQGHHAVGDRFTAVDAYLLVCYRWGKATGSKMDQRFSLYTALIRNLGQRPSVRSAIEAEGIDFPC